MAKTSASKTSVTSKAVNKVKSTPQKIIEHAVNTAINTVEKAAQTDVRRTAKRAAKTEKKLQKMQKIVKAAKTEAKRATTMSSNALKLNHSHEEGMQGNNLKNRINQKIQEIISQPKEVTFYYDKRQQIVLLGLYSIISLLVYIISETIVSTGLYNNWFLLVVLIITQVLTLLALAAIFYVVIMPPKLAVVNKEGIKIDHNQLLKWQDIALAEEKYTSYISRRPFMALHLKDGALAKYRLTLMQKLCKKNIFTAFSIPMYAMRPQDAAAIRELIKKHVKYEDNRN
ncbi:hypothetical protein IJ556_02790 [bacterium]|nr:hypothetical protein [bacterium]MBR2273612.1 hypothetical protein [Alphaproteobacteria bacterium]